MGTENLVLLSLHRLFTQKGSFCVYPRAEWVRQTLKILDNKRKPGKPEKPETDWIIKDRVEAGPGIGLAGLVLVRVLNQ